MFGAEYNENKIAYPKVKFISKIRDVHYNLNVKIFYYYFYRFCVPHNIYNIVYKFKKN